MRNALALLLIFHGLAHVAGFLAPWGIAPSGRSIAEFIPDNLVLGGRIKLGGAASRGLGIVWLMMAASFAGVAWGLFRHATWFPAAALGVSALSLIMTLLWWPAARIGVAVNVVVLAALSTVGLAEFSQDLRVARERVTRSVIAQTAAGPIEYATVGEGIPVLALHGTAGGWDQGLRAASGITRYGYRVIAPSRFGYLRTPWRSDASPAVEADSWVTLLDSLGVDRVAVMSWSAGAAPAIQLALRHPSSVSKLVFFVPGAGGLMLPKPGPPIWVVDALFKWNLPIWTAQRLMPNTMLKWVAVPASLVPTLAPEDRSELNDAIKAIFPVSARHDGRVYDARSQSGEFGVFPIEQITAPTLWISAADDLYGTLRVAKHASSTISNARLLQYETGGHMLLGRSSDYWPRVDRFLRGSMSF